MWSSQNVNFLKLQLCETVIVNTSQSDIPCTIETAAIFLVTLHRHSDCFTKLSFGQLTFWIHWNFLRNSETLKPGCTLWCIKYICNRVRLGYSLRIRVYEFFHYIFSPLIKIRLYTRVNWKLLKCSNFHFQLCPLGDPYLWPILDGLNWSTFDAQTWGLYCLFQLGPII